MSEAGERTITLTEGEINRLLLHWYFRAPPSSKKAGEQEIAYVVSCHIEQHEREEAEKEYNLERDAFDAYYDRRMGYWP